MSVTQHESQHDLQQGRHSPSIWAFILIAVGVIWLLLQANILSGANLAVLFRLWPVILIAIGLQLLVGRGSRSLSLLIGGGTVILLLVLMALGPSLGLARQAEVQTVQYSEPLDDATSARINLDFSVGTVNMHALSDANELIDADLRYIGEVDFQVSGTNGEKVVELTSKNEDGQFFDFLGFSFRSPTDDESLLWQIGLSPAIPLDLHLNGGVGNSTVDLSGVQLSSLRYNNGVGQTTISLPEGSYSVDLQGGVGEMRINFASDAAVDASINGGVGKMVLDFPDNAPVRVETNGGLGGVDAPANFSRVDRNEDNDNNSGVWESDSYAAAEDGARIDIEFDGGVGGLTIE